MTRSVRSFLNNFKFESLKLPLKIQLVHVGDGQLFVKFKSYNLQFSWRSNNIFITI